ncbi:DedA family protein [Laribacter hongkongensis]|jgi:membrane protein DedA with SNARE-associated domain|uniref:Alpha-amylase n=1 Tax=Laribacter hongkongensis TaxID=168471 RepID=A0A248LFF5_9NEIS|nr:DedA family protein [Laribacter hongkongensis]ASJ23199.1 alpha-amylase [Laribacter hongkongensis]MBE5527493.1 alpha-amylase [Laribacter hongkongensis]MCG8991571.1 DedA family protein [Laribacter hongkongensis]MCG8994496.1 DedA family protein [Laribacter hongkongensis]MCG8996839.1 DedA family protein [Laribacter hongkongensis]
MDILQTLIEFFTGYGYAAVFLVLLACGFGLPIPEDITLVAGGIISGLGYTHVHTMFAVGMAGVLAGDATMFLIGRLYGPRVRRLKFVRKILTPSRFRMVQGKFARYGNWVLFVARFLPGLRSPIFLTAGMTRRIPFWRFLLLDGLAALISVPVWVYLGYFGAYNRDWLMEMVHRGQHGVFVALGILAVVIAAVWWRRHRRAALPPEA